MNVEIGFWNRDEEGRRVDINVTIFGGKLTWACKRGHHQRWEPYEPTEEDWEALLRQAEKRVPRRVISSKYVELIRRRGRS